MKIDIKRLYSVKGENLKYTKIIKLDSLKAGELLWLASASDTMQALCFMEDECTVIGQADDWVDLEVQIGRVHTEEHKHCFRLSKEEFDLAKRE